MSQDSQYHIARLGFVANHQNKVKDGSQYDKYFPKSSGKYEIVQRNGSVKSTVDEMDSFVRETLVDTQKIAPLLKGKTLVETCRNVYNFWFQHCKYKLDKEGVEELRRPRRAWHDGQILARNPATSDDAGIDCDCFSISVASTLLNLNISCKFRITKYDANWQHVYVIVPLPEDPTQYYVIDCVLDEFNYQKTYSDKFDHRMEAKTLLGGIPIAKLSGVGSATVDNSEELDRILSGCHFDKMDQAIEGLGTDVDTHSPMLNSIYDQLVATRDYIAKNPNSVDVIGGAKNHLKMLNAAIAKFWTPLREQVLSDLEKAEEKWNAVPSMGTVQDAEDTEMIEVLSGDFETDSIDPDDIEILEGLGKGLFKKVVDQHKKVGQKFFSNIKTAVKAVDKINKTIIKKTLGKKALEKVESLQSKANVAATKAIAKTKEVAKKAGAIIKKFLIMSNPLTLLMRAGFLLAMKENVFHMAERLLPGVLSQSEAAKKNVSESLWKRSVDGYDKVAKMFEAIGGKRSKLEKALKTGRAGKKKGLAGIDGGLGEPYSIAAAIVAAASVILAALSKMAQAGITRRAAQDQYKHEEKLAAQKAADEKRQPKKGTAYDGIGEEPVEEPIIVDEPQIDVEASTPGETAPSGETQAQPNSDGSNGSDGSEIMDEVPAVIEEGQKKGWGKKMVDAIKKWFGNRKNKKAGEESAAPEVAEEQADSASVSNSEVPAIEAQNTSEADAKEAAAWKAADVAGTLAAQSGKSEAEAVQAAAAAYTAAGGINPSQFQKEGGTVAQLQAAALAAAEKAAASKAEYDAIVNARTGGFAAVGKFIKNNPVATAAIAVTTLAVVAFAFDIFGVRTKVFGGPKKHVPARLSINGFSNVPKYRKGKKVKKSKKFLPKGSHVQRITMK